MSGARPDTWMPFYIGDYLQDTMHLTTEQHGAYVLLLLACWKRGGVLPKDDGKLAAIARLPIKAWQSHKDTLEEFFQVSPDGWRQKRVAQELAKATVMADAKAKAGAKGAAKRWQKDSTAIARPLANASQIDAPSQSPSPSPVNPSPAPVPDPDERARRAGLRCLEILGRSDDPTWNYGVVHQWLADGCDPEKHIFPTLKRIVAEGRAASVTSLNYFTKAVMEARDRRPKGNGSGADDADPEAAQRRQRVSWFAKHPDDWLPDWGPRPTEEEVRRCA